MAEDDKAPFLATPIQSLAVTPTLYYDRFLNGILEVAGNLCTADHAEGLNFYHATLTDLQYAALHLILRQADGAPDLDGGGNEQPIPREPFPEPPALPAANAAAGAIRVYESQRTLHHHVAVARRTLRALVIQACGDTIQDLLSLQPGGIAQKTLPQILLFLEFNYGSPTADDLNKLRERLNTKFTSAQAYPAERAKFQLTAAALTRGGDAMSQIQLISTFTKATAQVPGIGDCIERYNIATPDPRNQVLADLAQAIQNELRFSTVANLGYAANASQRTQAIDRTIEPIIDQVLQRLDNMEATFRLHTSPNTAPTLAPQGGNNSQGTGTRTKARQPHEAAPQAPQANTTQQPKARQYCFCHGYQKSHASPTCKVMEGNAFYTAAMKRATVPCKINGTSGAGHE